MSAAPRRQLGLFVTAAIVIANMIGTGVFTSTGFQAAAVHDPMTILLLWVVGGVYALCGAVCYAELGTMMPEAGGEYIYLTKAYHPAVGFMSGWASLTAGFSAPIATAALAFAAYLAVLVPGLRDPWAQKGVAIALIIAITGLHSFDTRLGGRVQAGFTAAKVVLIVVFIIAGIAVGHGDWGHFTSQHGGFANVPTMGFAISLMYVSFAYSGWNAAAYIAGEVTKPERNLPRSLLLGTGIVTALYLLLNVVFLYGVPSDALAAPIKEVGAVAASNLFGERAGALLTSVIALALVSAVSAMVMAGPRVYTAMAADRALPPQLGWHSKRGVPGVAVLVQGVLSIVFVIAGNLKDLMELVGFTLAIFAALTVGALFVMRGRGIRTSYRAFGYPLTPVLFIGVSAWIAYAQIDQHPRASAVVGGLLAVGALAYALLVPKPQTVRN